ncbi:hypothetical protein [Hyphomicrobium sp. DY-1]|uniref:hypothetical protein n=1 Tax=Hyphomicrobium sp. DY-1 TaxID=3075650 RepID=UPI0039C4A088
MRATKLKPTPLAKTAGLSPSTILRALDEENPSGLERRSIQKIVDAFGYPWPQSYGGQSPAKPDEFIPGFSEEEMALASPKDADTPLSPTQADWQIKSRVLELAGYLPGDFVRADSSVMPRPNDIVVAQILRTARPGADTVLRLYDPPYLTTATMDDRLREKPRPVDNVNVSIWGVVVRSWRVRGY